MDRGWTTCGVATVVTMILVASCTATEEPLTPTAVPSISVTYGPSSIDTAPAVWTDRETGCQYLIVSGGYNGDSPAITPRMTNGSYASGYPDKQKGCR